jgi:hypothetical protein
MYPHFLKRILHHHFTPIHRSYSSANGTDIHIIGEVTLNIAIKNVIPTIKAAVAKHLVADVLLGADWIAQYVVFAHFKSNTLFIRNSNGDSAIITLVRPASRISPPSHTKSCSMSPPLGNFPRNKSHSISRTRPILAQRTHHPRLGLDFNHCIICGTAISSMPPSSDATLVVSHRCYVCNLSFLSNNNLYRHLRAPCYPPELRQ